LIPGELVPDALFQALKALADPTRLRIMRYLSAEPLTPAELSRRLRLRAPTVIHHLHALRLARLVHLTIGHEGRRYEARREAVTTAFHLLDSYLDSAKTENKSKKG
jgi:DNA-binding transcriptional ArsR family regulator